MIMRRIAFDGDDEILQFQFVLALQRRESGSILHSYSAFPPFSPGER